MPRYWIYEAQTAGAPQVHVTGAPRLDALWWSRCGGAVKWWAGPLPAWLAAQEAEAAAAPAGAWLRGIRIRRAARRLGVRLQPPQAGALPSTLSSTLAGTQSEEGRFPPDEFLVERAASVLDTRSFLEHEARRALEEACEGALIPYAGELLQFLYLQGRLTRLPAVAPDGFHWVCNRCGSRDEVDIGPCAQCGRPDCPSCLACVSLGVSRGCAMLYRGGPARRLEAPAARGRMALPVELTPAQRRAAEMLLLTDGRESLVHAACGAGKTEVAFAAVARELERGGRVAFACPRRDVAHELAPRIQAAFPHAEVALVSGQSPVRHVSADITVSTAHQLLRFHRAFHLTVFDEADAFPLRGDAMLWRAARRATAHEGRLIWMSATPHQALLERVKAGLCVRVAIPARHHGRPLPEPEVLVLPGFASWEPGRAEAPGIEAALAPVVESARAGHPLFVFVPYVRWVEPVSALCRRALEEAGVGARVGGVHAAHPRRAEALADFKSGRVGVLVATTVLERGVTVAGADVAVFGADREAVFDASALVQMAGRAGRTAERPDGRVVFVAEREGRAIQEARRQIRSLNQEAREAGFLKG